MDSRMETKRWTYTFSLCDFIMSIQNSETKQFFYLNIDEPISFYVQLHFYSMTQAEFLVFQQGVVFECVRAHVMADAC